MKPSKRWACWLLGLCFAAAGHAAIQPAAAPDPGLTAAEIVEKNAAARGGADAWQKITAMAWAGRVESSTRPSLPFVLEQKRPNKTRFELTVDQTRSVRIFDGEQGWKLKSSASSARPQVEPFTPDETSFARNAAVIDGPVMDFNTRGYAFDLEGIDDVRGHKAYRLRAAMPSGQVQRVWIDATSFVEVKLDRMTHDKEGRPVTVSVYFDNYKTFDGLQLPMLIETRNEHSDAADRLIIERLALNPTLADRMFEKPRPTGARRTGVVVDTRSPARDAPGGPASP